MVDGRDGIMPEDRDAFRVVKASGKPFLTLVNKCDRTLEAESYLVDFYEFGSDLIPCRLSRIFGIDHAVEWILGNIGDENTVAREGFRASDYR